LFARFCVDPIEKKPLNHFLPATPVLSFGTAGCKLSCKFFQNSNMSKSREMDTPADWATPEMLADPAERLGCASVAYACNAPAIFMEYADDVALAKHRDLDGAAEKLKDANQKGPHWADTLKAWGDDLAKRECTKDALAKSDETLTYAPNGKHLKEAREAVAKQRS